MTSTSAIVISRSALRPGIGFNNTLSATLNTAVVPPMPSARINTASSDEPLYFSSWRKANFRSFITQSVHRIHFCGPTGGDVTRHHRDCAEQQHHAQERHGISSPHLEKFDLTAEHPGDAETGNDSHDQPEAHEPATGFEDQTEHISAPGAERHAHADFVRPASHQIGKNAVDAGQ